MAAASTVLKQFEEFSFEIHGVIHELMNKFPKTVEESQYNALLELRTSIMKELRSISEQSDSNGNSSQVITYIRVELSDNESEDGASSVLVKPQAVSMGNGVKRQCLAGKKQIISDTVVTNKDLTRVTIYPATQLKRGRPPKLKLSHSTSLDQKEGEQESKVLRRWTFEEDEVIRLALYQNKRDWQSIAKQLNRTETACRNRYKSWKVVARSDGQENTSV